MFNPLAEINWNPGIKERRKFAVSLVLGFPCVALVWFVVGGLAKGHWQAGLVPACWLAVGGIVVGGVLWAAPQIARPVYVVWYFATGCVGLVLGNLMLAGFYYLVMTPIGAARRWFARTPVSKGFNRQATTYWKDAGPPPEPERYFKQF